MSRHLPARPSLEHLRKQAKRLLREARRLEPGAVERLKTLAPLPPGATATLVDAQHVIAREHGFASWPKLKRHVEALTRPVDPVAALVAAVNDADAESVRALIETHPELASRLDDALPGFHFGATPLLAALPSGNRELIDVLLRAGANIDQKSHWWAGGFGVLDNDGALAEFLIERGATVDVHAAVRLGMRERLERLLAAEPGLVHARGGDGQTPLHVAQTVDMARYLLERGAEIDARDVDHESTPAQYMVRDRQDVARFLVASGCRTDILMAAALGELALVRRHLDADPASIRTRVSERHFPKINPHAGGTIYMWTLGGHKTAHAIAREFGHEDVFHLLVERSPAELLLSVACEVGDESLLRRLLAEHPDLPAALTDDDRRKLADAAHDNNTKAVRLMLAAGWPAGVRGNNGSTALHWAAFHGNVEMIREILRHGPALDARDREFNGTPLGWAIYGSEQGWHRRTGDYAATVTALLDAGAKSPELTEDLDASDAVLEVLRRHAVERR